MAHSRSGCSASHCVCCVLSGSKLAWHPGLSHFPPTRLRLERYRGSPTEAGWSAGTTTTRFTVFRTGKVVIFGGKCVDDATTGLRSLADELQSLGMAVNDIWQRKVIYIASVINDIVSSGYIGCQLDLKRFADHRTYCDNAAYETEQFPGLRYRNLLRRSKGVTATVFNSGKVIITGAKLENEVLDAYDVLHDMTQQFAVRGTETEDPVSAPISLMSIHCGGYRTATNCICRHSVLNDLYHLSIFFRIQL